MENHVHSDLTADILSQFSAFFELDSELQFIRYFENFVYESTRKGEAVILRITHSSHRSTEEVRSELHWLTYLHERGMPVAPPIAISDNTFVHHIDAEHGSFTACLFKKAQGKLGKEVEITPKFIRTIGDVIGRFHKLSVAYQLPDDVKPRRQWYDDEVFKHWKDLPSDQAEIQEIIRNHVKKVKQWPTTDEEYGLIHSDVHYGNFFVQNGAEITLFDFDDTHYNYYITDVVTFFYSTLTWMCTDENRADIAHMLHTDFWEAYEKHYSLPEIWKTRMRDLVFLRMTAVYSILLMKLDLNNLSDIDEKFIADLKQTILTGEVAIAPYLN